MFQRPTRPYAGYIFDCDGTLAHSMPLHLRAWQAGLAAAGAPPILDKSNFMSVAGMALRQTIDHWNREHAIQIDAETVMRVKNAYYEEHFDEITPLEEVVAHARDLARAGAKLAVASGGTRLDVVRTLRHIGVADIFPVVVTAEDVARAKPAPDLFLEAARRLGVEPRDCIVYEDSPLGVQAAQDCGMDWTTIPVLL